jgi:hypothetical protein
MSNRVADVIVEGEDFSLINYKNLKIDRYLKLNNIAYQIKDYKNLFINKKN